MRFRGLVLILVALPVQAQASEALWAILKSGGQDDHPDATGP